MVRHVRFFVSPLLGTYRLSAIGVLGGGGEVRETRCVRHTGIHGGAKGLGGPRSV